MSMDYKRCLILIFSTNTVCESMAYRSLYHIVCLFLVSSRQHRIIPIIPVVVLCLLSVLLPRWAWCIPLCLVPVGLEF